MDYINFILLLMTVAFCIFVIGLILLIPFKSKKALRYKNKLQYGLIYSSSGIVVAILAVILGFIFSNGMSKLSFNYVFSTSSVETQVVTASGITPDTLKYKLDGGKRLVIEEAKPSMIKVDADEKIDFTKITISTVDGQPVSLLSEKEIDELIYANKPIELKITKQVQGLMGPIIATMFAIITSLVIALPIGIISAIYLVEYSPKGKIQAVIHFAIDSLAGIPSIVYGLFGSLFFVGLLGLGVSVLSGALTMTIMLLPTIIRTTEEALHSVPNLYREASYGLGANKLQTIFKVVLPAAVPGILVAVILAVGRVIGESAILIFTMGTFDKIPTALTDSASTLTVKAYILTKELGDISGAAAIGIIIIFIVLILNIIAKLVVRKYERKLR
ncbi:MAG: phosphate ABC transporter permease PstA [Mycoplasmatales bacterium]